MIKSVVFDLGGVVFERSVPKTMIKVSEKYNIDNDEVKRYFDRHFSKVMKGKSDEDEFFETFIKKFNLPLTRRYFHLHFAVKAHNIEGTWKIIRKIKGKYHLGIISDITQSWADYKEKKSNLSKIFDTIIYSHEKGHIKPSKKIYLKYIKESGFEADECIFIDDKEENVEGAAKLGFKAILFENPEKLEKELKKYIKF
jgi:putative hydrolase of the HAD superfamily